MLRKGFTLIELLIVITIIAILAGAAVPYVQDYIEDARISKTKTDLGEIKNSLTRFELDRGVAYTATGIGDLVGPYLDKAITDAWGTPFEVDEPSCKVLSWGPNRNDDGGLGDDISVDFRPPLALSKAYWVDNDKNGVVSNGDAINVRFSRPANPAEITTLVAADWSITVAGVPETFTAAATAVVAGSPKAAVITITTVAVGNGLFIPGRDTINYVTGTGNLNDLQAAPLTPAECAGNLVVIQPL